MNEKEELAHVLKTNHMLEEFFELNKIPGNIAMQSLLSLYFTMCSELEIPSRMIDMIFDEAKDKYREITGMKK